MSGIYIKGIEMPTSCRACPMKMNCDDCEGLECVCVPLHILIGYVGDLLTDKRRDDCPLVPVPEHGDLIDRDALLKSIRYVAEIDWNISVGISSGLNAACDMIEDAQTIIPPNDTDADVFTKEK